VSRISGRLDRLPGSATLAINTRARQLVAEGRDVISFGAGEPDFRTPENIVEAAVRAARDPSNHHYTPNVGLEPLRAAIVDYTKQFSGVSIDADQVVVTNGAKQAIFQALAALLDPGDEVLLPDPHWVTYPASIDLAGGTTVSVPTTMESGFAVSVEDLDRLLTERTKVLMFVSPSNPTGTTYSAEEARRVGQWARDNDLWVIADEIYQRLVYGKDEVAPSIATDLAGYDKIILINGVAKSYAMTGWRVGWLIAPKDVAAAAARHQSHSTSNVNNVAQMAALEALTGPQDSVESMRLAFDRRRRRMMELLDVAPGVRCARPDGAFYVFPDVTDLTSESHPTSAAIAEALIEQAGIAVVPGESFGAPGHLRLSYALSDDELERGVARMVSLFGSL
jgi:aspartate/methionine/tyrosine aminotransferase